jgi:hypothetical protein
MDSVKQRVKYISKGRMVSLELWDEKEGKYKRRKKKKEKKKKKKKRRGREIK